MATWKEQLDLSKPPIPASIKSGVKNGELPASALVDVRDSQGRVVGQLCKEAARSWQAMVAAAAAAGISLRPGSFSQAYRTLGEQQRIFSERYTQSASGSTSCGGKKWQLIPGEDVAACPGTSNHGMGLAVDFQRTKPKKPELTWMEANAHKFGWSWGVKSEEWHVTYRAGDTVPPAVLEFEQPVIKTSQEDDMVYILSPDSGIVFLHAGKLLHVESLSGLDSEINQWDLRKDATTWARVVKAYGPVIT